MYKKSFEDIRLKTRDVLLYLLHTTHHFGQIDGCPAATSSHLSTEASIQLDWVLISVDALTVRRRFRRGLEQSCSQRYPFRRPPSSRLACRLCRSVHILTALALIDCGLGLIIVLIEACVRDRKQHASRDVK